VYVCMCVLVCVCVCWCVCVFVCIWIHRSSVERGGLYTTQQFRERGLNTLVLSIIGVHTILYIYIYIYIL
jgi:hypothetical protein